MSIELRKKNDFEKDFFKLMSNSDSQKTMENVKTEQKKSYSVSEPNYHSKNFFAENMSTIEMRKTQIFMNKPV